MKQNSINWTEHFDRNDNSIWEGPSPYYLDGANFYWRLEQRLENNKIRWFAAHDDELGGEDWEDFATLEDAKNECQKAHDHIIEHECSPI